MGNFIHLHNHTDFSLLDGAASCKRLVAKAKELNMEAIAITDHGNMFGVLKFYQECKKQGIKPIIGNEFYIAPSSMTLKSGSESGNRYYHLILLAKNNIGYKNLMILSSLAFTKGFYYKPRIDFEILSQYCEGLICCSACIGGLIPSLILKDKIDEAKEKALEYDKLFGRGNYYLELQDHGIPEQKKANIALIKISEETGIPLVATNDIHYVDKDDSEAQEILICIGTQKKLTDTDRMSFYNNEFYLKTEEEMKALFPNVPQAIENTLKISQMCNLEINRLEPQLPDFEISSEFDSPAAYLHHLTMKGLKEKYPEVTEEIKKRAEFELSIIIEMNFTGYFLIVWDFIRFAMENNIPVGPGRGSGAGSVTAYALYITNIDPFKYDLLFERFLNPERVSMPDFDIDFCYERRQEVINYVTNKYGEERVAQIITFGTLKPKAVLKDVARVLDIPFDESNKITKLVPDGVKSLEEAIEKEEELKNLPLRGGVYSKLINISLKLQGLNRHPSLHAAGIVIGKEELVKYVPLYKDSKTGAIATQFTMEQLEDCSLVKMDFLGLRTLTIIKNTETIIHEQGNPDFSVEKVPETDKKTYKMLSDGKSECVFQFESAGMQKILKNAKPESIEDLIALNALYRPGPMDNIPQFVDSKNGKMEIKYPHPSLKDVLKPTYGVIVYQEQVMQVARIIAGFSLGKADLLRRAMGKKQKEKMDAMRVEFIEGALKNGYTEKLANDIFVMLEPFAGYGFNKSHAAAYSVLAYQTAYLKANHPAEFMAANLTNEIGSPEKLTTYIAEAKHMGLEILPPHINLSAKDFNVSGGKIVYGLIGIKNVGTAAVEAILREREQNGYYKSFIDFIDRNDLRVVNKKVLETLVKSGLFDSIENSRRAILFSNMDMLVESASREQESKKYGQSSLFDSPDNENGNNLPQIELEESPEWPEKELLIFEKENLGFYFSGHPLSKYKKLYDKCVTLRLNEIDRCSSDKKYTIFGIINGTKQFTTKKGELMASVTVETYEGEIQVVMFPKIWNSFRYLIIEEKALGFTGKIDKYGNEPKLMCEFITEPDQLKKASFREVHFSITETATAENLDALKSSLLENNGSCEVYLHLIASPSMETVIKAAPQVNTTSDEFFLKKIGKYPFIKSVWRE